MEAHIFFDVMWQGGASTNLPRVKREAILYLVVISGSLGRSRGGPFTSGCVRGMYSRASTIMKTINDVIDGASRRPEVG